MSNCDSVDMWTGDGPSPHSYLTLPSLCDPSKETCCVHPECHDKIRRESKRRRDNKSTGESVLMQVNGEGVSIPNQFPFTTDTCVSTCVHPVSILLILRFKMCRSCHKPQDSLFSSSSGYTNYRGILNLCIILLVLSNARVALENILKYGILVDPLALYRVLSDPTIVPCVQIFVGLWIMSFVSLFLEKIFATGFVHEEVTKVLVSIHTIAIFTVPAYIVYTRECQVAGAVAVLSFASITFLKMISYHMVNHWCRLDGPIRRTTKQRNATTTPGSDANQNKTLTTKTEEKEESTQVQYPDNLNVNDLVYFMLVPTLCYELNFPRNERIRKRFLIRRAVEVIFLSQLMLALAQQWLLPTIINSVGPLKEMNYPKMFERLLKLAVSQDRSRRVTLIPPLIIICS